MRTSRIQTRGVSPSKACLTALGCQNTLGHKKALEHHKALDYEYTLGFERAPCYFTDVGYQKTNAWVRVDECCPEMCVL